MYKSRSWVWNDPDVIPTEPGNQLYYLIEKISNLLTGSLWHIMKLTSLDVAFRMILKSFL